MHRYATQFFTLLIVKSSTVERELPKPKRRWASRAEQLTSAAHVRQRRSLCVTFRGSHGRLVQNVNGGVGISIVDNATVETSPLPNVQGERLVFMPTIRT